MPRKCFETQNESKIFIMEPGKLIENIKDRLEAESIDAFEVCYINQDHLSVEARDKKVESFVRSSERGVALRLVKGERIAWASTSDFSSKAVDQLIKSVSTSVEEISPSEEACLPPSYPLPPYNEKEKQGRPLQEITDKEKIDVALTLERETLSLNSKIKRVRQPLYEEVVRQVIVCNSHGVMQDAKRGMASCEVRAIAESKGVSESGYDFHFSPRFEDLQVVITARNAAERALSRLGAAPLKTGRYDVVFESRAAANLLRLLTPSFFAGNVQRKKSAIANKKGERIYNPIVTVVDDGLLPDGYGSFPFDDEGVPRRKNYLVKEGVVHDWLYDSARAARDKRSSTGSCKRPSIHGLPTVDVSNCYLQEGNNSPKVLLSMTDNGFYITDVMGLHTANMVTGDFSLGAEGFHIKDGLKGAPIRGVIVAGNIHDIFKNVKALGVDLRFIGHYGAPSILVPKLQIGGGR